MIMSEKCQEHAMSQILVKQGMVVKESHYFENGTCPFCQLIEKDKELQHWKVNHNDLKNRLAVQEAGHKGILCDALGIEHYQHDLHELTLIVAARISDLDTALRDQFAMAAMPAILDKLEFWGEELYGIAALAYRQADAMMEERKKSNLTTVIPP
jgi:hypothetical protein